MRERRCRIWHEAASERPLPACGERVGVRGRGSSRPRPLTRSAEPVLGLAEGKTRGSSRPLPALRGEGFRAAPFSAPPRSPRLALDAPLSRRRRPRPNAWPLDLRRAEIPRRLQAFRLRQSGAPKGGTLALQIKRGAGNQNFDTFNTLNIFVLKGDGAAGMDATFDSLMAGSGDEPDALYGLVAHRACAGRPTSSPTASCCVPKRGSTTDRG